MKKSTLGIWWALLLLITIDQVSKYILLDNAVRGYSPISSTTFPAFAQAIAFITIISLLLTLRYTKPHAARYCITIILAGGISNLLNLLTKGYSMDIFTLGHLHFNLADIYIVLGGVVIFIKIFLTPLITNKKELSTLNK